MEMISIENLSYFISGTFVVFIIGFFGNLLCLLVLCRRREYSSLLKSINSIDFLGLRRNSYTQYLIALAIVDSGAIFCEGNDTTKKFSINLFF